ncbi:YesL family protein [Amycolatopsis sp. NPDC049688]|uniref:YesL family protein n=1 Tax=Amycolatopsis sp. NPDC049688 TaxID=3154733 RepID=UPI003434C38E
MRTQWRTGLGDFSDCLLAGVLVALASVPVVTAGPAFVAGCRVLDRARHDLGRPLWTTFWADFREAARGGVAFGLGCLAAVVLLAVDLEVVASMPGAGVLQPALWVLAAAGVVVAVRTCEVVATAGPAPAGERPSGTAGRSPDGTAPSWRRAIGTAARETAAAPGRGVLLAAAAGIAGLLIWMLPILALVVAGPLALAAVATGGRR